MMTRGSVKEYVTAVKERYRRASRGEKARLLDEFTQVTGYHRKAAIRRLAQATPKAKGVRAGRTKQYGPPVAEALNVAWQAADQLCSKRLKPFLPELLEILERHEELVLEAPLKSQLCQMSAATIDRLLKPYRKFTGRRPLGTTKPGSLLKAAIPIRTFAEWDEVRPGFLEIDLVAHCGESTAGFYLNTLSAVDVATGWVECQGVWGKGQERVGSAIHHLGQRLPFPLLGLDSDNGSEFINQHLYAYCQRSQITFTRSRPYKKNDGAHVEQKNWSVVRRVVGYERYSSKEAHVQLNRIYQLLRLYVNFFQPVMQLQHKSRHGAKVHKVYDAARTPYQRVLESGVLAPQRRAELERLYLKLNPVALKAQIDQELQRLWDMADIRSTNGRPVTLSSEATKALR